MNSSLNEFVSREVSELKQKGIFKAPRKLQSEQAARVQLDGHKVVMLGSNNYLGLASHPKVKEAVLKAVEKYGCGTASVSEVCGLSELHHELMQRIANFTRTEAALLYPSCSTANMGVVDGLMGAEDVIFSDELNHASIVDGCRISKATIKVYPHKDMAKLEEYLSLVQTARFKMVITDGVFSMEGDTAPLDQIVKLAEKYSAITVVDESHSVGVLGQRGAGAVEHYDVANQIDIQIGTFGKALGGAGGAYVCGGRNIIDYLFHRSRAFIFTNALPPATIATGLAALLTLEENPNLLQRLRDNTTYFIAGIKKIGLTPLGGESSIVPILIGDTAKAFAVSRALMQEGVFVTAVGYPVVPKGAARLRAQVSAAHTTNDLDSSLEALAKVTRETGVL